MFDFGGCGGFVALAEKSLGQVHAGAGLSGIDFEGTAPKCNRFVRQACFDSDDRKVCGGGGIVRIFLQDCFVEGLGQVFPSLPVMELSQLG